MVKFLAIVFFISAFISGGDCALCAECSSDNGLDCEARMVTCGNCSTTIIELYDMETGNTTYSVIKTCNLDPESCNLTSSISSGTWRINYSSSCCQTDLCNNQTIQAPLQNYTENGLECPTCFSVEEETCVANGTVRCTGSETKCLTIKGKADIGGHCQPISAQGCATENLCTYNGTVPIISGRRMCDVVHLNCSAVNSTTTPPVTNVQA